MPKRRTKKDSDDDRPGKEERKRSRKGTSPLPSPVAESSKRRRKHHKKEERRKKKEQKQEEHKKAVQKIVDIATEKLKQENEKWKDGTHPDFPKTLRTIREQKVRDDLCIICLGGGDDGGPKVDLFSACCGQAYHASCYLQQLAWAQKKASGSSNSNNDKCGVCRQLLPILDSGICLTAKPERPTINSSVLLPTISVDGVMGNWRNYSFSSSSSSSSSSNSSSSSSSSSSSDDSDPNNSSDESSEDSDGESARNARILSLSRRWLARQNASAADNSSEHSSSSSSDSISEEDGSDDDDNENNNQNPSASTRSVRYDSLDRLSRTVSSDSALDRWFQRDRAEARARSVSMPRQRRRRRIRSRA